MSSIGCRRQCSNTVSEIDPAKAIVETIGELGYVVQVGGAWGRVKITATE